MQFKVIYMKFNGYMQYLLLKIQFLSLNWSVFSLKLISTPSLSLGTVIELVISQLK